jgi:hypothetical protein
MDKALGAQLRSCSDASESWQDDFFFQNFQMWVSKFPFTPRRPETDTVSQTLTDPNRMAFYVSAMFKFSNQQQGFDRGSAYSNMTRFHRETRGICRSAMASTLSVSMDVWSYHSSNPHSVGIYFSKLSVLTRHTMAPRENGTSWPYGPWYVIRWATVYKCMHMASMHMASMKQI